MAARYDKSLLLPLSLAGSFEVKEMLSWVIERTKKLWQRRSSLPMVLAGSALLNGCAALGFEQTKPRSLLGAEDVSAPATFTRCASLLSVPR
jgi:hypothetical protein